MDIEAEIQNVKKKIEAVESELKSAEEKARPYEDNDDFDSKGAVHWITKEKDLTNQLTSLNNLLSDLQKKENILLQQQQQSSLSLSAAGKKALLDLHPNPTDPAASALLR